jgi:hypothetical protein
VYTLILFLLFLLVMGLVGALFDGPGKEITKYPAKALAPSRADIIAARVMLVAFWVALTLILYLIKS